MKRIYPLLFVVFFMPEMKSHAQAARVPKNVAIYIFNDVQIIDYTGPYEVFTNASSDNFSQFNVYTVSETTDKIITIGGMSVIPKYDFSNHPRPDIIVIPGGWGVYKERKSPTVINWIRKQANDASVVLSVCNGAGFLATAGLLDSLSVTSTAGAIDGLKKQVPGMKAVYDKRFVDNGKIVTSAGLTAGIDAALHVVKKVLGEGWAQKVAIDMEYNWQPESKYARALFADRYIPPVWWLLPGVQSDPLVYRGDQATWTIINLLSTARDSKSVLDSIVARLTNDKRSESWTRSVTRKNDEKKNTTWWTSRHSDGSNWEGFIGIEQKPGDLDKLIMTSIVKLIK